MDKKLRTATNRKGQPLDLGPIRGLLARIRETFGPEQVWLFGSRARGDGDAHSDWDLFVVVPDGVDECKLDPMTLWQLKRGMKGVYADVVPCRSTEFADWKDTVNTLSHTVSLDGVLLYEREDG